MNRSHRRDLSTSQASTPLKRTNFHAQQQQQQQQQPLALADSQQAAPLAGPLKLGSSFALGGGSASVLSLEN